MEDVYIVSAVRTATGKARKGALAQVRPDEIAAAAISAAVERAGISPELVQDVVMGCANPEGEQGMNVARIAALRGGLLDATPAATVNRLCASGLEAMAIAAGRIETGQYDIAVAGGLESMSLLGVAGRNPKPNPALTREKPDTYISMGHAGDAVARDNGFTREQLDAFALSSHQKAVQAMEEGRFNTQIVPLKVPGPDNTFIAFDTDEGPRPDTTLEALGKLPLAFSADPAQGRNTARNSSPMSDGAAALLLMGPRALKKTGLSPLARLRSYSVAAGSPKYLGPAQLVAIPRACELAGIKLKDVGLYEINEAFAAVALLVKHKLNLAPDCVNVNGGAIALGHPLGCTGAKLSVQMVHEMRRRQTRFGVVTMCVGGGQAAAGVFELCRE